LHQITHQNLTPQSWIGVEVEKLVRH